MNQSQVMKSFLRAFLIPTVFNKLLLLYFGLNYSQYPGEGYGYGLIASIIFLIFSLAYLIWKFRGIEDP